MTTSSKQTFSKIETTSEMEKTEWKHNKANFLYVQLKGELVTLEVIPVDKYIGLTALKGCHYKVEGESQSSAIQQLFHKIMESYSS